MSAARSAIANWAGVQRTLQGVYGIGDCEFVAEHFGQVGEIIAGQGAVDDIGELALGASQLDDVGPGAQRTRNRYGGEQIGLERGGMKSGNADIANGYQVDSGLPAKIGSLDCVTGADEDIFGPSAHVVSAQQVREKRSFKID